MVYIQDIAIITHTDWASYKYDNHIPQVEMTTKVLTISDLILILTRAATSPIHFPLSFNNLNDSSSERYAFQSYWKSQGLIECFYYVKACIEVRDLEAFDISFDYANCPFLTRVWQITRRTFVSRMFLTGCPIAGGATNPNDPSPSVHILSRSLWCSFRRHLKLCRAMPVSRELVPNRQCRSSSYWGWLVVLFDNIYIIGKEKFPSAAIRDVPISQYYSASITSRSRRRPYHDTRVSILILVNLPVETIANSFGSWIRISLCSRWSRSWPAHQTCTIAQLEEKFEFINGLISISRTQLLVWFSQCHNSMSILARLCRDYSRYGPQNAINAVYRKSEGQNLPHTWVQMQCDRRRDFCGSQYL